MPRSIGPFSNIPKELPEHILVLEKVFGSLREALAANIFYKCWKSRLVESFGVCNELLQASYIPYRDDFKQYLMDVPGLNEQDANTVIKLMEERYG